jgi:hypothetical protein
MKKGDAIDSMHLALNDLSSALYRISRDEGIGDYPLEVNIGTDRLFVLDEGLVVYRPDCGGIPCEQVRTSIKVLPYPPTETGGGSGHSGEEQKPKPSPEPGADKVCPACNGTGKVK